VQYAGLDLAPCIRSNGRKSWLVNLEEYKVRKLIVITCFLGLFAASAMAAESGNYPKAEIFGGYQYSHLEGGINANGFDFTATGNFSDHFGIAADFGSSYTSQSGVSIHNYTYTFGPVLSLRANKGYTPWVHALIGGDTASAGFGGATASNNGFAVLAGGGADFNFNRYMAFRGGADWMMIHGNGSTSSKNLRMLGGIVLRF